MTTDNKIPASDTVIIPQVSDQTNSPPVKDFQAFIDACRGQPASLEKSQVSEIEEHLKKCGTARRIALYVATKPYDELEKEILNDRDLAVAMADAVRCFGNVDEILELISDIVTQSTRWILVALSAREDCDEIMKEVRNSAGGDDAETP